MSTNRTTFHESWYRVTDTRPRPRTTMQTSRQRFRGQMWYVVRDPSNSTFFRVNESAWHFVGLLDGRRTVAEAWRICNEQLGDNAPTQGEVINLLGQLYAANLLRSDLPADAASLFETQRRRVRREVKGTLSNLMFLRIPLGNPDAWLGRWERMLGIIFSRPCLLAWLVLVGIALTLVTLHSSEVKQGFANALSPDGAPILFVSFIVVKVLHELGHGLASKRIGRISGRGGNVHTFGVALLVFAPVPFVDASSSWAFPNKWHRALVGAAGMYVELAVASLAAIVWVNTSPGTVQTVAFNIMFAASVVTILFNANPLLRFDGYYMLSDLMEIPNLAGRGREAIQFLFKRHVFGLTDAVSPALTSRERVWLPIYGAAAAVNKVVISVGIILFVVDKFFFVGVLMALTAVVTGAIVPFANFIRWVTTDPSLERVRRRAVTTTMAGMSLFVVVVGLIPFPDRARAEGVLESVEVSEIYAEVDGFVDQVLPTGTMVAADGHPLLVASSMEVETRIASLYAEYRLTELERDAARFTETALSDSLTRRLAAIEEQIIDIEHQRDALTVKSPQSGYWVAADDDRLVGSLLRRGDAIGVVVDPAQLIVRTVTDQRLGPRIETEMARGAEVEVRAHGRPDIRTTGTIREVLPAAFRKLPSAALSYAAGGATAVTSTDETGLETVDPFFEVQVDVDAADSGLRRGQRVVVRFELPDRPLIVQAWRGLRQLVQRRFQT